MGKRGGWVNRCFSQLSHFIRVNENVVQHPSNNILSLFTFCIFLAYYPLLSSQTAYTTSKHTHTHTHMHTHTHSHTYIKTTCTFQMQKKVSRRCD